MNTAPTKIDLNAATLAGMRRLLLAAFLLGVLGTGAELLLLEHTEDRWQWAPLALFAFSLAALIAHAVVRRNVTRRLFQATMLLFIISGVVGIWFHYQGKVAFKVELNPDLRGMELFWEAIKGAAVPPVLAPGTMILLGLLGLAFIYRRAAPAKKESTITGE